MGSELRVLILVLLMLGLGAIPRTAWAQKDELAREDDGFTLLDDRTEQTPDTRAPPALPEIDLQTRSKDVRISPAPGAPRVIVTTERGDRLLTPDEYVAALAEAQERQRHAGWLYVLFNITKPIGFLWVAVGFLGQVLFTFRMLLQWWASEKHKRSVIPVGFWWGSLFGGLMLFVYFCWRKDVVGVVGQSTGVFVYARNLILIYRGARAA